MTWLSSYVYQGVIEKSRKMTRYVATSVQNCVIAYRTDRSQPMIAYRTDSSQPKIAYRTDRSQTMIAYRTDR